jgi:hypothetical protein
VATRCTKGAASEAAEEILCAEGTTLVVPKKNRKGGL